VPSWHEECSTAVMTMRRARVASKLALLAALSQSARATGQPRSAVAPSLAQQEPTPQAGFTVAPTFAQQELTAQADYLLILYELYGLAWTSSVSGQSPEEITRLVSTYFTNGASATGIPNAGPGAAYFQNGSQVLAAPTASWIPTTSPDLGAGSLEQSPQASESALNGGEAGEQLDAGTGGEATPAAPLSVDSSLEARAPEEDGGISAPEAPTMPYSNMAPPSETPLEIDDVVVDASYSEIPVGTVSETVGPSPVRTIHVALPVPGPIAELGPTAVAKRIRYVPRVLAVVGGVVFGAMCALVGVRIRSRRQRRDHGAR
jgi:hypothetical protein